MAAGSSPVAGFASVDDELAYYKTQYEQLESELQDFQASSRELEIELERDVDASEKRERQLKEKVEKLGFEVDEWKTKCKQTKIEANQAHTTLQKEITTLRDTNRTLQLNVRDIEVANDDYERQARHTTSSLEDLESKYNVSIERAVMLEEEVKLGEQEREKLRIDNQRLRDDLSDLKIEAEIVQEKLKLAEAALEKHHLSPIRASRVRVDDSPRPQSPGSFGSVSMVSMPSPIDPSGPAVRAGRTARAGSTPPSPPLSDPASIGQIAVAKTPSRVRTSAGPSLHPHLTTPSQSGWRSGPGISRHGRTFSGSTSSTVYSASGSHSRPAGSRPSTARPGGHGSSVLPRSGSLYQIRGLIGKMQQLEQRVHNARLKLPASAPGQPSDGMSSTQGATRLSEAPTSVTMRSPRKRQSFSTSVSSATTPTRPSFGPASRSTNPSRIGTRTPAREASLASTSSRTSTGLGTASRPASRASGLSKSVMGAPPPYIRPGSQASSYGMPGSRPSRSSSTFPSPTSASSHAHAHTRSIGMMSTGSSPTDTFTQSTRVAPTDLTVSLSECASGPSSRPVFAPGLVAPVAGRRKSSGLPVRRQSSAYPAPSPDLTSPTRSRIGIMIGQAPPVPPLPPYSPVDPKIASSAGCTPAKPLSGRMGPPPSNSASMSHSQAHLHSLPPSRQMRPRAPTVSGVTSPSVNLHLRPGSNLSSNGGVGLGKQHHSHHTHHGQNQPNGQSDLYGDIGETF